MVAAGEAGGILDTILMRLATFMEKNDALVRKVKGAMIYPGVIMGVAGTAIIVLLLFVIPVFQSMFASVGLAAAAPRRASSSRSRSSCRATGGRSWAPASSASAASRVLRHANGQLVIDRLMLQGARSGRRAPQVGRVALHAHPRHAHQLGRQHPRRPRDHGQDGGQPRRLRTPSSPLAPRSPVVTRSPPRSQKSGVFPPMVISMIAVGEQTGGLDEMLSRSPTSTMRKSTPRSPACSRCSSRS
jgi:type IV pilus assembly protein PilC